MNERGNMTGPELEGQREKDLALLAQIRRCSDVSKPHQIEHHFRADSRTGGIELLEWARLNGFQVSPLQEGRREGQRCYGFDLIKSTIPTLENISPDTTLMLRLAAEFECTYDGWGCEVVP
jgi:regulator of RNase E activity RraB